MADVVHLPGLFEQIRLVAGLRWRILRNNLKNKNRVWDVIGVVISSIIGIVFVAGMSFLFFAGTLGFLKSGRIGLMALPYWGVFLWWQVMPIFVAGFSPTFSFRTLLRFPLKLTTFYVMAIAYGLADSSALAATCWLLAMLIATAIAQASLLPVMLVATALFVALNVALERLLGAWLEKILEIGRAHV